MYCPAAHILCLFVVVQYIWQNNTKINVSHRLMWLSLVKDRLIKLISKGNEISSHFTDSSGSQLLSTLLLFLQLETPAELLSKCTWGWKTYSKMIYSSFHLHFVCLASGWFLSQCPVKLHCQNFIGHRYIVGDPEELCTSQTA